MCGYVSRKRRPMNASHSSSVAPLNASDSRWMKFFIVSVATTSRLSPSVYAAMNAVPRTWTSIVAASSVFDRPSNADSGIAVTPSSGVPYVRYVATSALP